MPGVGKTPGKLSFPFGQARFFPRKAKPLRGKASPGGEVASLTLLGAAAPKRALSFCRSFPFARQKLQKNANGVPIERFHWRVIVVCASAHRALFYFPFTGGVWIRFSIRSREYFISSYTSLVTRSIYFCS